jgi:Cu2+-exporting ATPase
MAVAGTLSSRCPDFAQAGIGVGIMSRYALKIDSPMQINSGQASIACCAHCGERVKAAPLALAEPSKPMFCCEGCRSAHDWISNHQLGHYYSLRDALKQGGSAHQPMASADEHWQHWDDVDLLSQYGCWQDQHLLDITLIADGMRCAACAWLIEHAIAREHGVLEVCANAASLRVRLRLDVRSCPLSRVVARLASLGYRAQLGSGYQRDQRAMKSRRTWLLRLGIALLGAVQAMMLSEASYLDFDASMAVATRDFLRWVTLLVSTPVVFFSGWPFLHGAYQELRHRRIGMDALVASSVLLAYFASVLETLRGGPEVYFDAAVMFVLLLLIARALEARARAHSMSSLDRLLRAQPEFVQVIDGLDQAPPFRSVAVQKLQVGELILVRAGESIPVDCLLLGGAAELDESLLTGEADTASKSEGSTLLAGSVALTPLRARVLKLSVDSWLTRLLRMAEQSMLAKPKQGSYEKFTRMFALMQVCIAAAVYLCWLHIDAARAFPIMLSVLAVSCPCALALAIPIAQCATRAALLEHGVLSTGADELRLLARTGTVVFDKTGTLSDGQSALSSIEAFGLISEDQALALAAALERSSMHPWAHGIVSAADARRLPKLRVKHRSALQGSGVMGEIDGKHFRLGRSDFAAAAVDDGAIWLGDGKQAFARFSMGERVRPDAMALMQALDAMAIKRVILSGDGEAKVRSMANMLGFDRWQARCQPEDKIKAMQALAEEETGVVVMVGDGLNDAPVLAASEVSVVVASGAALALKQADVVLTQNRLLDLGVAISLARRGEHIVRQNLVWAALYNFAMVPLAAVGMVSPWLAAVGMAGSSLMVTLNALRITRAGRVRPHPEDAKGMPRSDQLRAFSGARA